MKNKLELLMILIDQIIIVAFIITLVIIIRNIITDKQVEPDSTSQTVQVQQEPVSTSETAESTIESTVEEQSKVSDETVESTDTDSEAQVNKPGTVNIDLDSDPDISSGLDGFADPDGWVPASDDEMAWALDLAEKNGTVLH